MTTTYEAMTPCGGFQATWSDDEESPVAYSGSDDAIAYFKAFLDLNSVSGRGGALIRFDSLEPDDLYGFCQSAKYGITVLPTVDDLMDITTKDDMTTLVLDGVTAADSFELIGEGAQILRRLDENSDTFFADIARLRDIITALGDDTPGDSEARTAAVAYLQSVIDGTADLSDSGMAAELGKIHAAYGGDADMLGQFKNAAQAYVAYALAKASAALNKG